MKPLAHMSALALAAALLAAGCAQVPPPNRAEAALPERYADATAAPTSALIAPDWWKAYGDTTLDALVERTLSANTDLRVAASRVDEAAAVFGLTRSAQWPTVTAGGSVTRSRSSTLNGQPITTPEATSHRLALSSSFEIDLWGRLRDATRAAQEQLLASRAARDTVALSLAGVVVQTHFAVRSLDLQVQALDAQLATRRDGLALVQRRVKGGLASGLDQAQAEAALAALSAQRLELQRQRELLVHQLGQLSLQPGLQLPVDTRALPLPDAPPPGLPSDLLQRRPDLLQAEATMRAAFASFDVTRKEAWPTLSLTGSFGGQSSELSDLLKAGARIWSIGPSLLVSLFDAGRNEARSLQSRAQAEQAALGWQKAAQTAFREVADALSNTRQLALQDEELQRQQRAAQEALRLATRRYDAGYSAYLEVLDAQRSLQDAELALLRLRQARLDAQVSLVKALGGGWTAPKG